jgi:hypothetical protein
MAIQTSSHDTPQYATIDLGRVQVGVVMLMLVLSLAWLVVYLTVLTGGNWRPPRLSPAVSARLASEHDTELRALRLQMSEIYGEVIPPPAGS